MLENGPADVKGRAAIAWTESARGTAQYVANVRTISPCAPKTPRPSDERTTHRRNVHPTETTHRSHDAITVVPLPAGDVRDLTFDGKGGDKLRVNSQRHPNESRADPGSDTLPTRNLQRCGHG
jgi:hypothetical protein